MNAPGLWGGEQPALGIGSFPVGRNYREELLEILLEGLSPGVTPIAVDDQGIGLSFFDGRSHFFIRYETPFDPPRIKQECQSLSLAVPQFLIQFQKGEIDGVPSLVEQMNSAIGFAATHGS